MFRSMNFVFYFSSNCRVSARVGIIRVTDTLTNLEKDITISPKKVPAYADTFEIQLI